MSKNKDNRPKENDHFWRNGLVHYAADSMRHNRDRRDIREEGRQERENDTHRANLDLRNKMFDYAMQDDETRKFVIDTARDSYSTGKKILKVGGIALLSGLAIFAIYKVGSSLISKYSQSQRVASYTKDMNTENLTYKNKEDYKTWADKLYNTGFDQAGSLYVNYDESLIKEILGKMKTVDDWKYLVSVFGSREVKLGTGKGESHDLPWFLSQDDDSNDYQEILTKLGVEIQL